VLKKTLLYGRLVLGTLIAVIFAYIIYRVVSVADDTIQTMHVSLDTSGQYIEGRALFIRDEKVLPDVGQGLYQLIRSDGEKIAAGDQYAVLFSSAEGKEMYEQKMASERIYKRLTDLSSTINDQYDLPSINREIYEALSDFPTENYFIGSNDTLTDRLNLLLLKRHYALRPELMEETLERYSYTGQDNDSFDVTYLRSSYSGYYVTYADGYEELLSMGSINNLSLGYVSTLINNQADFSGTLTNCPGKIVTDYEWQFALPADAEKASSMKAGKKYDVYVLGNRIQAVLQSISEEENGRVLLLFSSDANMAQYATLRFSEVRIVLEEYTGYRIPIDALRMIDGKTGVYCLQGYLAKFVEVEILWKGESYYIADADFTGESGLFTNDYIILNTKGIKDGMVITRNPQTN